MFTPTGAAATGNAFLQAASVRSDQPRCYHLLGDGEVAAAAERLGWPDAPARVWLWQAAVARNVVSLARAVTRAVTAGVGGAAVGTVFHFVPAPFAGSIGKLLPRANHDRYNSS